MAACRLVIVSSVAFLQLGLAGCGHFEIFKGKTSVTAVPLSPWNQHEPHGIPYYLPKPLLVIAKNVRHIDSSKPGLTYPAPIPGGFDNQASYADIKANISMPVQSGTAAVASQDVLSTATAAGSALPDIGEGILADTQLKDGLTPEVYYTYQIVFVPDLSQKYGLRIKGGPGEIRAAMNLVNGWMYTGMGPYYMKDSSTAQNMMACGVGTMFAGRGVADVLGEVNNFQKAGATKQSGPLDGDDVVKLADAYAKMLEASKKDRVLDCIPNYAEIVIYEPVLTSCGETEWRLVAQHNFDRQFFRSGSASDPGVNEVMKSILGVAQQPPVVPSSEPQSGELYDAAVREELGIAQAEEIERPQTGALGEELPSGGVVAIQQNAPCCETKSVEKGPCFPNLFKKHRETPRYETRVKVLSENATVPQPSKPTTPGGSETFTPGNAGTGTQQSGALDDSETAGTTTIGVEGKLSIESMPGHLPAPEPAPEGTQSTESP